ncbi:MAG TPA: hypothetical protein PKI20_20785 [Verrucomicrobiota bacterium]|nr:hypothetical protein [Verrucomicrobiota bacterium]
MPSLTDESASNQALDYLPYSRPENNMSRSKKKLDVCGQTLRGEKLT